MRWLVAYFVTVAAAVAAPDYEALSAELESSRERWRAARLEDYSMILRWYCYCDSVVMTPLRIAVKGGSLEEVTYAEPVARPLSGLDVRIIETPKGAVVAEEMRRARGKTVEGLFSFVAEALSERADDIRVRYHPELGYPVEAHIDYARRVADEEQSFTVLELEP